MPTDPKDPASPDPADQAPFRVHLRGVVDVLSKHLYSSPAVFVRELLQNAVDAIEARRRHQPGLRGRIVFEVDERHHTITMIDNGIGLTRDEIAEFLACVGSSSKHHVGDEETEVDRSDDFIGQFGIGLLSAFMVTDEIVMLTKSIEDDSPTLEWRGQTDGTYSIKETATALEIGTRVVLVLRKDAFEYGDFHRLVGLAGRYGGCLDHAILVQHVGTKAKPKLVSDELRLWEPDLDLEEASWSLPFDPMDAIPIEEPSLGLRAVGYILPSAPTRLGSADGLHRIYLKGMFVTDADVKLVPPWATFARFVIHSTKLRPTASREGIREDDVLRLSRDAIAKGLAEYLRGLRKRSDGFLAKFVDVHDQAMRQVALEDNDFFSMIIDLLDFDTSMGRLRFGSFRADNDTIRLAVSVDQFRACSAIAAAQGLVVFNGGYVGHTDLLERAASLDPELSFEVVDVPSLVEGLRTGGDREGEDSSRDYAEVLRCARRALAPLECGVSLSGFDPVDVPAVFAEGADRSLSRSIGTARDESESEAWDAVLGALETELESSGECESFLCLNTRNDVIKMLSGYRDRSVLESAIRVLYVQSLMLGRQPLTARETQMFGASLAHILQNTLGGLVQDLDPGDRS